MILFTILKRFIINYYFEIIHLLFLILLISTSFSCSTLPSLGRRWRRRPGPCRRYDLVQDVVDGGAGGGAHGRVREVQEGRGHGAGDTAQDGGSRTEQGADKLVLSLRPFIILDSDVHQSQNWRTTCFRTPPPSWRVPCCCSGASWRPSPASWSAPGCWRYHSACWASPHQTPWTVVILIPDHRYHLLFPLNISLGHFAQLELNLLNKRTGQIFLDAYKMYFLQRMKDIYINV